MSPFSQTFQEPRKPRLYLLTHLGNVKQAHAMCLRLCQSRWRSVNKSVNMHTNSPLGNSRSTVKQEPQSNQGSEWRPYVLSKVEEQEAKAEGRMKLLIVYYNLWQNTEQRQHQEVFILVYSLAPQSVRMEKSRQQELEASGHMKTEIKNQFTNTGA